MPGGTLGGRWDTAACIVRESGDGQADKLILMTGERTDGVKVSDCCTYRHSCVSRQWLL